MSESEPDGHRFDAPTDDLVEYRSISALAVVGLLLGIASGAAVLAPMLWIVPIVAICVNALALGRIASRWPELIGRKAALAGLGLSVLLGVAAPTNWYVYRHMVQAEARQFAQLWFDAIRSGDVCKAHQLTIHPSQRAPLDSSLAALYQVTQRRRDELKNYASLPAIKRLLELGDKAQVHFEEAGGPEGEGDHERVDLIYVVTYEEGSAPKTFYVACSLERFSLDEGQANWRVRRVDSLVATAK
jgi:hypothetical protein